MQTEVVYTEESLELKLLLSSYEKLVEDAEKLTLPQAEWVVDQLLGRDLESEDGAGYSCLLAVCRLLEMFDLSQTIRRKVLEKLADKKRWLTKDVKTVVEAFNAFPDHQTQARLFDLLSSTPSAHMGVMAYLWSFSYRIASKQRVRRVIQVRFSHAHSLPTLLEKASDLRKYQKDTFYNSPAMLKILREEVAHVLQNKFGIAQLEEAERFYKTHYWTETDAHHYLEHLRDALQTKTRKE